MGFFKDLRDDISQAVNELLPEDDFFGVEGENAEENDLLHLEKEKEQTGIDDVSFDRTTEAPFAKEEPSFNGDEGGNLANENVQEDILAALAHLGEDVSEESAFGTMATESVEEENKEEWLKEAGMEEVSQENTKEELATEDVFANEKNQTIDSDSFQEKLNGFTQVDSIDSQENEQISNDLQEPVTADLTSKESEDVFGEPLLEETDLFSEEELLKVEPELDLLEEGFSEEEVNLDFLEADLLDGDALENDLLSEEATMDLFSGEEFLKEEPKVTFLEEDVLKENSLKEDVLKEEAETELLKEDLLREEPKENSLKEDVLKEEVETELLKEDLLREEPKENSLEEDVLKENSLKEDVLKEEPETELLGENLFGEPKIDSLDKELLDEESSIEQSEYQSDQESVSEDSVKMQETEVKESMEALSQEPTVDEVEELLLTNVQSLETIEEESNADILKDNMEAVSMTGDLETFVEQQEEEFLPDDKKAEVLEPTIEENITEKGEKIMESNLENVQATDQVTVITKGTVINGSISSDGGLEVNGTITGDVECLGKLIINGNVSGHLKAAEVVVSTPRLDGGIDSEGDVKIGVGTIVIGDVTAKSSTISGAVKGEIDVQGPVIVDSTAIVKGNITAKSIQINNGAVVDGYCKLSYAEVDIDNFFDGE